MKPHWYPVNGQVCIIPWQNTFLALLWARQQGERDGLKVGTKDVTLRIQDKTVPAKKKWGDRSAAPRTDNKASIDVSAPHLSSRDAAYCKVGMIPSHCMIPSSHWIRFRWLMHGCSYLNLITANSVEQIRYYAFATWNPDLLRIRNEEGGRVGRKGKENGALK